MIDVPKKGKKFVMKRHFEGLPTHEDFLLVEEDIPELQPGGIGFFNTTFQKQCYIKSILNTRIPC